jgi:hypothetical protein
VRTFYRDAPSLNSDNRNAAAATNVTRFAMPVMVADTSIKTLTMLLSCGHNRQHPRSEPQCNPVTSSFFRAGVRHRSLGTAGGKTHFAPATRIAYRIGGPQPSQWLFAVFDYGSGSSGIEFGVGRGLTHSADSCMLKLMLMRDL